MKLSKKIINRLKLESKLAAIRVTSAFKKFKPEDQFIIFSDPRGGSTWLAEMLQSIPESAMIWEPLNIRHVRQFGDLGFGWRQFIPENESWPEANLIFNLVFAGRIINEWTMLRTDFTKYYSARHLIIKFCRGNMLIPWLVFQYNFKYRPIYLVRHPFAVVLSQIKQGGWESTINKFIIPDTPYNDLYLYHQDYLYSLSTREEILTAYWCLANLIPLNHKKNNVDWITVYYENLIMDPASEIGRIFSRWELDLPEGIQNRFRKSSSTALDPGNLNDPFQQISRWQRELKPDQIDRMKKVLGYFEVSQYAGEKEMPCFD